MLIEMNTTWMEAVEAFSSGDSISWLFGECRQYLLQKEIPSDAHKLGDSLVFISAL